jgi:hypothetical protein
VVPRRSVDPRRSILTDRALVCSASVRSVGLQVSEALFDQQAWLFAAHLHRRWLARPKLLFNILHNKNKSFN